MREYILAGISILFWASTAAVSTLMMDTLSTMAIICYGSLAATVFLFLVNLFTGRLKQLRGIKPGEVFQLGLLGLLGMFFMNLFLYYGLAHLKAQQAFIINYLWPILIVVFSCLLLGQQMTGRKALALLLSFFGVVIVATEGSFAGLGQVDLLGVLACACGAVCYALFSVLNVKLVTCDKFVAMMIYYGTTTLAGVLALLVSGPLPALTLPQVGGCCGSGC